MKILAINGSPRGRRSNTDRILQPFLEGGTGGRRGDGDRLPEGPEDQSLPGLLHLLDEDPRRLRPQRRHGGAVSESPPGRRRGLRHAPLRLHRERADEGLYGPAAAPGGPPTSSQRGAHYTHPPRYTDGPSGPKGWSLISNCGFPERHHFSGLVETFRRYTDDPDTELAATILCAGGELLAQPALAESLRWYTDAARRAGWEFVTYGPHPAGDPGGPGHAAGRSRRSTQAWPTCGGIARSGLTPPLAASPPGGGGEEPRRPVRSEPRKRSGVGVRRTSPHPSSCPWESPERGPRTCREAILGMPTVFNPAAAGDLQADIQFVVTRGGAGPLRPAHPGGALHGPRGHRPPAPR
jgi:hypothetical protein